MKNSKPTREGMENYDREETTFSYGPPTSDFLCCSILPLPFSAHSYIENSKLVLERRMRTTIAPVYKQPDCVTTEDAG
jgi:hypothetical protein